MKYSQCIISVTLLMMSGIACTSLNTQHVKSDGKTLGEDQQLLRAASSARRGALQELLASGMDIDVMGKGWGTPLYQAVLLEDANAVQELLECGAGANKGNEHGRTPLHAATQSESKHGLQMIELLIAHGANVNARITSDVVPDGCFDPGEGKTPLHIAAGTLIDQRQLFLPFNDN